MLLLPVKRLPLLILSGGKEERKLEEFWEAGKNVEQVIASKMVPITSNAFFLVAFLYSDDVDKVRNELDGRKVALVVVVRNAVRAPVPE